MKNIRISILFAFSILTSSCKESDNNPIVSSKYDSQYTKQMESILNRTESFGIDKYIIGFWTKADLNTDIQYMNEDEVKSWSDAGFTLPQSPTFDTSNNNQKGCILNILDWTGKYGMKLILNSPLVYGYPKNNGMLYSNFNDLYTSEINKYGSKEALFGFHIGDEPNAVQMPIFIEAIKKQKVITPKLHPFTNLLPYWPEGLTITGATSWPTYLDDFFAKSSTDMLSFDIYTQMLPNYTGWDSYFENLRIYREASLKNGVPFWITLSSVENKTYKYRYPTKGDLRWQFYTSIVSGANGIFWYFYHRGQKTTLDSDYGTSIVNMDWKKTQIYYDLQDIQVGFHKRYGNLFNRIVSTNVYFVDKSYGGGKMFVSDSYVKDVISDSPLIIGKFTDKEKNKYFMIANNSTINQVTCKVIFSKNLKTFSWDESGNEYEGVAYTAIGSATINVNGDYVHTLNLLPGQETIYKIK